VKIKPKIKKVKSSNSYLAYYTSDDEKSYEALALTFDDAIEKWYKLFAKELGGG
jgi:hypothetical protein